MTNSRDLSPYRTQLENKLSTLKVRLGKVKKDRQKTYQKDFAEQAIERQNDEVLDEIAHETTLSIEQLERALQRMEDGNYGICEQCGEPISDARLAAIPEAGLCINCQD